jgi:RsiW-degrading membrane proteinase PrsW (M82 family)
VRKANKEPIAAVTLAFFSIWVVLAVGITAVWLTPEVRVFGLVMLVTAIVAGLLVVYFDWRAKLRRRMLAERDTYRKAA